MPLATDPEFKIRSEQTTYRILIGSFAAVLISLVACITAGKISGDMAGIGAASDTPTARIRCTRASRYEFVDAQDRVITSIVVQP